MAFANIGGPLGDLLQKKFGSAQSSLTGNTGFASNAANGVANPATSINGTPFNLSAPTSGAFGSVRAQPQVAARPAQTNPSLAFSPTASIGGSAPQSSSPLQNPGNNWTNPGYSEQALNYTQNRLLEDPFQGYQTNLANQASQQSAGQNYMNQNLGSLNGPGQGSQYWNSVQGQFQSPFAGEQYARQATQNFSPTGAAGAFNNQAQQQYGQFTGYSGPGNTQGQYGQSASSLAGGTQGENALGQIAGGYSQNGQYGGPNLAAGQYAATQQSFGDLPAPDSADPFYDRSIQLGTQAYNQGAAGRGVYGSSEALSGVGNIITDLNAKRAQTAFGNSMAIAQENRARQQLLGEQARMGDVSGLDAFNSNLKGAETYGNLANMQGNLELGRNQLLGNMANAADTQALGAQNSNIAGLNALGNIAGQADTAETNRYNASTNAMNNADRTAISRLTAGGDLANAADAGERADYSASMGAAANAASARNNQLSTASQIASTGSRDDLSRVLGFNQAAIGAENSRQGRNQAAVDQQTGLSRDMSNAVASASAQLMGADQQSFDDWYNATMLPLMNKANMSQQEKEDQRQAYMAMFNIGTKAIDRATR